MSQQEETERKKKRATVETKSDTQESEHKNDSKELSLCHKL